MAKGKSKVRKSTARATASDVAQLAGVSQMTVSRVINNDPKVRDKTRKTVVFVTHSIPEAVFLSTRIVVMSPRPGRITDVIESTLPKERPLDIRDTPEFLKLAHRVREGLRAGHAYDD